MIHEFASELRAARESWVGERHVLDDGNKLNAIRTGGAK
jgi:hypothetical protein